LSFEDEQMTLKNAAERAQPSSCTAGSYVEVYALFSIAWHQNAIFCQYFVVCKLFNLPYGVTNS
jgi:hypothetical protein